MNKSKANLLRVVIQGDESRVKEYLKQNSDFDPKELARTLWHALRFGHLEIALLLVQGGADINLKNPFDQSGSSLLQELLKSVDPRYYQLALQLMDYYGADMNACNNNNESVLHSAIILNKTVDVIEELMNRGARLEGFSKEIFCHREALEIAQLLFVRGHTDQLKNNDGVIHAAIALEKLELVQLLIEHGFDVNNATKDGKLPLFIASGLRRSDITELLIRSGARVNSYSGKPKSLDEGYPIHIACSNNSVENIGLLLKHGADINVTNSHGETPFSLMMKFNRHVTLAHQMMVEQFAWSTAKEKKIADSDLTLVTNDFRLSTYYTKYLNELTLIKQIKIIKDISFIELFEKDIRKLLFMTRDYGFNDNITVKQWKDQFPICYNKMISVFRTAKRQKMFYSEREEAICESLEEIIPFVPLERIIYFLYFN